METSTVNCSKGFVEPSCQICGLCVIPLFPITSNIEFDKEGKSLEDIYHVVTQKKLISEKDIPSELCLTCAKCIVRAYVIITNKESIAVQYTNLREQTDDPKEDKFNSDEDYINACNAKSKSKNNGNSKKNKNDKIKLNISKNDQSKTLVRCRFCKKILYGYQVVSHAQICTKPKEIMLPESNKVYKSNSPKSELSNIKKESVMENTTLSNCVINKNKKKLPSVSKEKSGKFSECLLLCKLCNQKLYVSQMNEHKKICFAKRDISKI